MPDPKPTTFSSRGAHGKSSAKGLQYPPMDAQHDPPGKTVHRPPVRSSPATPAGGRPEAPGLRTRLRAEFVAEAAECDFLHRFVTANLREFRRHLEPAPGTGAWDWENIDRSAVAVAALATNLDYPDLKQTTETIREAVGRKDADMLVRMARQVDLLIPAVLGEKGKAMRAVSEATPDGLDFDPE